MELFRIRIWEEAIVFMVMHMPFELKEREDFNYHFHFDHYKLENFIHRTNHEWDFLPEEIPVELGVAKVTKEKTLLFNNAGILFFGIKPFKFIPQAYVTCVRYQGSGKAFVIDRKDFNGSLIEQVTEAESFVRRHTRLAYHFYGFTRTDREEYPYEAIKEAILNAVSHRNYEMENTGIFVNVYDDRVEVISPGSVPDNLTLDEIMGTSHPRNPKIVELLHECHLVEKVGSGLKRMDELMVLHGLAKPVYAINRAFFQITFLGPKDKLVQTTTVKQIDLRKEGLNERQIKALNHFQEAGQFSFKEYWEFIDSASTHPGKQMTQRDLGALVKKGMIIKNGRGKNVSYAFQNVSYPEKMYPKMYPKQEHKS